MMDMTDMLHKEDRHSQRTTPCQRLQARNAQATQSRPCQVQPGWLVNCKAPTWLADQARVVLSAAPQNLDDTLNLLQSASKQ